MTDRAGEFALIARHFAPLARGFPGAYDLRDDAAVLSPAPGHELVAKTDAVVAGVHFRPDDPADLVARKALRVNLSDLAAKGARPRAYLLALIVPAAITEDWIAQFARGLAVDQDEFGIHLIGGDTDSTPGPVTISITALGEVPAGTILRRGGARPGDTIYVTGTIGDAALGLRILDGTLSADADAAAWLADRYRLPLPRVGVGPRLRGLAAAALDVSDGLVADLGHLCSVSNVDAEVDQDRIPLSDAARGLAMRDGTILDIVLTGGDDYEIAFAAPPAAAPALAALSREEGVAITPIGRLVAGSGVVRVRDGAGQIRTLPSAGWQHF